VAWQTNFIQVLGSIWILLILWVDITSKYICLVQNKSIGLTSIKHAILALLIIVHLLQNLSQSMQTFLMEGWQKHDDIHHPSLKEVYVIGYIHDWGTHKECLTPKSLSKHYFEWPLHLQNNFLFSLHIHILFD